VGGTFGRFVESDLRTLRKDAKLEPRSLPKGAGHVGGTFGRFVESDLRTLRKDAELEPKSLPKGAGHVGGTFGRFVGCDLRNLRKDAKLEPRSLPKGAGHAGRTFGRFDPVFAGPVVLETFGRMLSLSQEAFRRVRYLSFRRFSKINGGGMRFADHAYYHLYNRGAHRKNIFYGEENYAYLLILLRKYAVQYNVRILAYCLMPNHYHLIVQQGGGGSISRFMQMTFNAYVQALNRQVRRSGTIFEGKVKAKLIESDRYLVQLASYLHLNPVRARLVASPEEWEYSDYRGWMGEESDLSDGGSIRSRYFPKTANYQSFVGRMGERDSLEEIEAYLFEE